jgi:NADPH2:quinone reductase
MKEAIILKGTKVELRDVDFPALPSPDHLIIRVEVSGSNPKDWAIAERGKYSSFPLISKVFEC